MGNFWDPALTLPGCPWVGCFSSAGGRVADRVIRDSITELPSVATRLERRHHQVSNENHTSDSMICWIEGLKHEHFIPL